MVFNVVYEQADQRIPGEMDSYISGLSSEPYEDYLKIIHVFALSDPYTCDHRYYYIVYDPLRWFVYIPQIRIALFTMRLETKSKQMIFSYAR